MAPERGLPFIAVCLLFGITALAYANTLQVPFVFDGPRNIVQNEALRLERISLPGLTRAALESPARARPVAYISFALNYRFGGYEVRGYHVVNIAIHFFNGVLVLALLMATLRRSAAQVSYSTLIGVCCFGAALFVAHPVQTQAVTYIVQRMTSLAALFYLLTLLLYVWGREGPAGSRRRVLWALAALAWMLGLGTKQIVLTAPIAILLYELFFFRDLDLVWLRRRWPVLVTGALILTLGSLIYISSGGFSYEVREFSMSERLLTQFRVVVFYLSLLFYPLPSRLNLTHHFSTSHSLLDPIETLFSLLVLLALFAGALALARRERCVAFGILWFFLTLAIESTIVPLEMAFEHRLYLPLFGFALACSSLAIRWVPIRPGLSAGLGALLIVALATGSFLRNQDWQDELTIWQDAVAKSPEHLRARFNLANELRERGREPEALQEYGRVLSLDPTHALAHVNAGNLFLARDQADRAALHYAAALESDPADEDARYNLGIARTRQGRVLEAIGIYERVLSANPQHLGAHYNLALVLDDMGRVDEAMDHYRETLALDPQHPYAHNNLANLLRLQGETQAALEHYRAALRTAPRLDEARYNLGTLLLQKSEWRAARDQFSILLEADPANADARRMLELAEARLASQTN